MKKKTKGSNQWTKWVIDWIPIDIYGMRPSRRRFATTKKASKSPSLCDNEVRVQHVLLMYEGPKGVRHMLWMQEIHKLVQARTPYGWFLGLNATSINAIKASHAAENNK